MAVIKLILISSKLQNNDSLYLKFSDERYESKVVVKILQVNLKVQC